MNADKTDLKKAKSETSFAALSVCAAYPRKSAFICG